MTEKRLKCISIAHEAKFKALQSQLKHLKMNTKELNLKWEPCFQGKLMQVILMPVIFPIMLLFISADYLHKKFSLKWKIRNYQNDTDSQPGDNSLYSLWLLHGLDKKHSGSIRLKVLEQWLSILYPDQQYDIRVHFNNHNEHHPGEQETPHYHFSDEFNSLIKQLDLPDYE